MSSSNTPFRVAVLSAVFLLAAVVIVVYYQSIFIPVFLGAVAVLKSFPKLLTPKLLLVLAKNTVAIKIRQWITKLSTDFFIFSHRPFRYKLRTLKSQLHARVAAAIGAYTNSALWFRTAVALTLLIITASSSYVIIALLIIPQAIINWVRLKVLGVLEKLGLTRLSEALWHYLVPAKWRRKWDIYRKWTLGRRQIRSARVMHKKVVSTSLGVLRNTGQSESSTGG